MMVGRSDTWVLPEHALRALDVLESAGFEAWCVGGCIRDLALDREVADIDIAASALWQQARSAFEDAGFRTHETGVKHGTITVIIDTHPIEVTTYRTDGDYSDGRHPDSVDFVQSIEEDLARRDFTMNAIAFNPRSGICDPFGGISDLEEGLIRAVGDPSRRFEEDQLRILRACRFMAQLGFPVEAATLSACKEKAHLLGQVSAERKASELTKLLCGDHACEALMACIDVLVEVIPELSEMVGFDQRTPYHIYDVFEHTAHVVGNVPPYPLVRWAALFHDLGKPQAFFIDGKDIGHFYGHAEISVEIAGPVMRRLKLPAKLVKDVLLLVKRHDDIVAPTKKAVGRMLRKLDGRIDLFRALCDLKRGDALSQAPRCHYRTELADELDAVLDAMIEEEDAFTLSRLAIDGHDLIGIGTPAGPEIGRLLDSALNAVMNGEVANENGALLRFVLEASEERKPPENL